MGILAFIREPVPPARIRNPVLPNPVNSSLLDGVDDNDNREEVITDVDVDSVYVVGVFATIALPDDDAAGINAAE